MSDTMNISQSVNLPSAPNEFVDKGIWGGRGEKAVETVDPGVKQQPQVEAARLQYVEKGGAQQHADPAKAKSKPLAQMDVRLKFEVDAKTKDVKVLILDPATHKVIRTIPADELKNFREGDMVELYT